MLSKLPQNREIRESKNRFLSKPLREKSQVFLALGVIASMLLVTGYPGFVVFFFGIFIFFIIRILVSPDRGETRDIFEYYLAASEMLRKDGRRWFGFEINEMIDRGERALGYIDPPPPLLRFTVGALYHKGGQHQMAIEHLTRVIESPRSDEADIEYGSPELRNYVSVLRKIEREPDEAPLTSSAIKFLERTRKNNGKAMLDLSRQLFDGTVDEEYVESDFDQLADRGVLTDVNEQTAQLNTDADRKSITEVLHDIYDQKRG